MEVFISINAINLIYTIIFERQASGFIARLAFGLINYEGWNWRTLYTSKQIYIVVFFLFEGEENLKVFLKYFESEKILSIKKAVQSNSDT